jgi:hypothetical protein
VSPARRARPKVRYRVTVTELVDDTATVVMDATGPEFPAAVGDLDHAGLRAEHGIGGPPYLLEHLAQLIAGHPIGPRAHRYPGAAGSGSGRV